MARDTKQRMVEAAASSLRKRGLMATSFTDVLTASGAARGAIYHHFPGGKDDLVEHAVAWTGRRIEAQFADIDADDPDAVLRSFLDLIRPVVAQAAGGTSCAVAAVTVEAAPSQAALTAAAGAALRSWVDVLGAQLRRVGVASPEAGATAQLMIAFLEGSLVVARATGGVGMFDESAAALLRTTRALFAREPTSPLD